MLYEPTLPSLPSDTLGKYYQSMHEAYASFSNLNLILDHPTISCNTHRFAPIRHCTFMVHAACVFFSVYISK